MTTSEYRNAPLPDEVLLVRVDPLTSFFVPILTCGHESWVMTKRVRSQVQASEMRFYEESKDSRFTLLKRCVALRFKNLFTSNRYFSELQYLSLDGLAMLAECLRKDSPNKFYLPKQMGEVLLDDLELDRPITFRILDGIAWDFNQAK